MCGGMQPDWTVLMYPHSQKTTSTDTEQVCTLKIHIHTHTHVRTSTQTHAHTHTHAVGTDESDDEEVLLLPHEPSNPSSSLSATSTTNSASILDPTVPSMPGDDSALSNTSNTVAASNSSALPVGLQAAMAATTAAKDRGLLRGVKLTTTTNIPGSLAADSAGRGSDGSDRGRGGAASLRYMREQAARKRGGLSSSDGSRGSYGGGGGGDGGTGKMNDGRKMTGPPPLIVLDAPNIAIRHGSSNPNQKCFSCRGIEIAAEYFSERGHRVIGFIPDYLLDLDRVAERKRMAKVGLGDVRTSQLPDDVILLQRLCSNKTLIGTPPQDYDDSYCIDYAKAHDGYVVTNDMYRDHVKGQTDKRSREIEKEWTRTRLISYTWVGDEVWRMHGYAGRPFSFTNLCTT